jgi:phosphoglycerol transferase MdoB-like AlkP superfamily enzyme
LWGAEEIKEAMPELHNFDARDLGNEWGIFDEYLYAFMEEQMRTATKPQFFLVLTTSNHPPFEYPSSYKPLPLKISDERASRLSIGRNLATKRFLALQYANQKMGEFLTRLRKSSLADQVVVGLTGDHSYWIAKGVGLEQEFKRYAVPFFISLPKELQPANVDTSHFGSHEDIFPTLYHLTLSNQRYVGIGENLLSKNTFAQNSSGLVASDIGAYHHQQFWKWKDKESLMLEPSAETDELKALKRRAEALISITDEYLREEKSRKTSGEGNGPR